MLTVSIGRRPAKSRDDHKRSKQSDRAHSVPKHDLLIPLRSRFFKRFAKTIVESTREQLHASVQLSCLQQLFGANNAQAFRHFRAYQVLSSLTPVQRKIGNAG